MEFNQKLQTLRKQHSLTQDELAQALFVSRTAVSKWEQGRGIPSIESLKAIAKFFNVTVDELLSCDELLSLAEKENEEKERTLHSLIFGLIDVSAFLLFLLPLFAEKTNGIISCVSLLSLITVSPWLKTLYLVLVTLIILSGLLTLTFQSLKNKFFATLKTTTSVFFNAFAMFVFIIGLQPYAAVFLFVFLIIKVFLINLTAQGSS